MFFNVASGVVIRGDPGLLIEFWPGEKGSLMAGVCAGGNECRLII